MNNQLELTLHNHCMNLNSFSAISLSCKQTTMTVSSIRFQFLFIGQLQGRLSSMDRLWILQSQTVPCPSHLYHRQTLQSQPLYCPHLFGQALSLSLRTIQERYASILVTLYLHYSVKKAMEP
jgi:hypothetical protein